jgi:hypothetical protein
MMMKVMGRATEAHFRQQAHLIEQVAGGQEILILGGQNRHGHQHDDEEYPFTTG